MGYRVVSGDVNTNASGDGTVDLNTIVGALVHVEIDFTGAGASTTVDIDEVGSGGTLGRKILDKSAANTDVTMYPRVQSQTNDGTALTYDGTRGVFDKFGCAGRVWRVTVAGAGAALSPAIRVRLLFEA